MCIFLSAASSLVAAEPYNGHQDCVGVGVFRGGLPEPSKEFALYIRCDHAKHCFYIHRLLTTCHEELVCRGTCAQHATSSEDCMHNERCWAHVSVSFEYLFCRYSSSNVLGSHYKSSHSYVSCFLLHVLDQRPKLKDLSHCPSSDGCVWEASGHVTS